MKTGSVTIIDIAKLLGVSKSTVSRALKNHPDISQSTKDKINELAKQLNYIPNSMAVSFRQKRSKIIGLIVPQISPFFFPSVIKGVEKVIHEMGYNLMILQSNESADRERINLDILASNNVDGILVSVSRKTTDFSCFTSLLEKKMPIVFFDRIPKNIEADTVLVDDFDGAYRAIEHLIHTGKRNIAICIGNPNLLISSNRLEGYKKALTDHQIEINPQLIISGESTAEAYEATLELLAKDFKPDAILAISDLTMSGVMKAIYQKQWRIPEQIAVIGFCESTFSKMYNPSLSYINPMGKKIGKKAAQRLFDRINTKEYLPPQTILLTSELVVSKST